jgi:hypothetical protein
MPATATRRSQPLRGVPPSWQSLHLPTLSPHPCRAAEAEYAKHIRARDATGLRALLADEAMQHTVCTSLAHASACSNRQLVSALQGGGSGVCQAHPGARCRRPAGAADGRGRRAQGRGACAAQSGNLWAGHYVARWRGARCARVLPLINTIACHGQWYVVVNTLLIAV